MIIGMEAFSAIIQWRVVGMAPTVIRRTDAELVRGMVGLLDGVLMFRGGNAFDFLFAQGGITSACASSSESMTLKILPCAAG